MSILYGLLRDPSDRGILYIGARRQRLRTAAIPARFHLSGVLGYAAFTRNPSRAIVRDAAGKVVQDEDLGRGARRTVHAGGEQWVGCGGRGLTLRLSREQVRAMVELGQDERATGLGAANPGLAMPESLQSGAV